MWGIIKIFHKKIEFENAIPNGSGKSKQTCCHSFKGRNLLLKIMMGGGRSDSSGYVRRLVSKSLRVRILVKDAGLNISK